MFVLYCVVSCRAVSCRAVWCRVVSCCSVYGFVSRFAESCSVL